MPQDHVTRRGLLAATGAVPLAAAAAERQPVTTGTLTPVAFQRQTGLPLRVVTMYKFDPAEIQEIVARAAPHAAVEIKICNTQPEFRRELREAEVVYGGMSGADLDFAPKLKWMQSGGAGMEGLDPKIKASPVVVTNYARTFAHGISETAIGLLLALSRGLVKYYLPQFYLKKTNNPVGTVKSAHHVELVGRTMAIVGMGGIGSMIARRAHYGLDMRIIGTDAKPIPKPEYVAELHDPTYFTQMVPQADVLVAAAPHTPQTTRMFNEQVFRSMKKTAYFIAMSRGALFDDMALVKALKGGWIAGAGLDVFPKEPAPPGHPIFDCDNVIMSAHTSGWSPDRQVRLIDVFADNVRRYAAGLPLVNVVDKVRGY